MANDFRNWLTLGIAGVLSLAAFLIASRYVGVVFAVALMIFVFARLGLSIARMITGRDLWAGWGFPR